MKATGQIFLSYAREDEEKVERLYQKLSDAGFKPWMDTKDILPGEHWESCIRKAVRRSDFFLACLSANSVNKRGWIQREIKNALDIWQEKLEDDIYLIPVRLEDCEVPESLRKFQWVNLFRENDWIRLVKAIQVGVERRKEEKPFVPEFTPPPDPIAQLRSGVQQLLEVRAYQQAIDILNEAIKKEPSVSDAYYYLALALLKGKRPKLLSLSEVKSIEKCLNAAIQLGKQAHYLYLWALIKYDYYKANGLLLSPPTIEELLTVAQYQPFIHAEIELMFKHVPVPDSPVKKRILSRW